VDACVAGTITNVLRGKQLPGEKHVAQGIDIKVHNQVRHEFSRSPPRCENCKDTKSCNEIQSRPSVCVVACEHFQHWFSPSRHRTQLFLNCTYWRLWSRGRSKKASAILNLFPKKTIFCLELRKVLRSHFCNSTQTLRLAKA
jgi:hypothetical protein